MERTINPYYHHYTDIAGKSRQLYEGEHQNQQNLCNGETEKSSFQEEIRKNSVTLVWEEAKKPFPLLPPQVADVVNSQPWSCVASKSGSLGLCLCLKYPDGNC